MSVAFSTTAEVEKTFELLHRARGPRRPGPADVHRIRVHSSNVWSIGYREHDRVLDVEFGRDAGSTALYRYREVPIEVWQELLDHARRVNEGDPTASVGKTYHRLVRRPGVYASQRIG